MINWWNELLLIQQIFALIALPSTLLIVIQTVLMLIGIGGDGGADADVDIDDGIEVPDDGLAIFSVRGVTSMLCITGWVAVALLEYRVKAYYIAERICKEDVELERHGVAVDSGIIAVLDQPHYVALLVHDAQGFDQ